MLQQLNSWSLMYTTRHCDTFCILLEIVTPASHFAAVSLELPMHSQVSIRVSKRLLGSAGVCFGFMAVLWRLCGGAYVRACVCACVRACVPCRAVPCRAVRA